MTVCGFMQIMLTYLLKNKLQLCKNKHLNKIDVNSFGMCVLTFRIFLSEIITKLIINVIQDICDIFKVCLSFV